MRPFSRRTLALAGLLIAPHALSPLALADDDDDEDEDEEHEFGLRSGYPDARPAPVARTPLPSAPPAQDTLYAKECGSCHVAYPPRFLPARSWVATMNGLADHFGEDATLSDADRAALSAWLVSESAELRAPRIASRVPPQTTPLRISETLWFRGAHDEIPARMVTGNPEVKTWSACGACHPDAKLGRFEEHDVRIPGYGRFED